MKKKNEESEKGKFLRSLKKIPLTRQNFGWWVVFLLIVILLIGGLIARISPDPYDSYFDPIIGLIDAFLYKSGLSLERLDYRNPIILRGLAKGAILTLSVSIISVGIGFLLGALLAVILVNQGNMYGLKKVAQAYVDFFRSTPLLVQILLIYFGIVGLFRGLPARIESLGILYSSFAGTIALSLNTAAYQAEIIRGGILAIPSGQTEAARALGLTSGQTMRYVILPQTIRMVVPPLTNEIINILLNSSLLSAIGVLEITKRSQSLQAYYFLWQVFFMAAVFYFVIAFTLSKLTKRLEVKFRIPGLGVAYD